MTRGKVVVKSPVGRSGGEKAEIPHPSSKGKGERKITESAKEVPSSDFGEEAEGRHKKKKKITGSQ